MNEKKPGLQAVDGLTLSAEHRALLRPGEGVLDAYGNTHFLPRFFYEIPSWEFARNTRLSEHFTVSELMSVDCREAPLLLKSFPHYVPCAVSMLVRYLEELRSRIGAPVHISANGGYRSPAHRLTKETGPHAWGTAANIYRIGDTFLDNQRDIETYGNV